MWENGKKELIRFSDNIYKKQFDFYQSMYKVADAVRAQEILTNIMFGSKGKNVCMIKFVRGFHRLKRILRFAKMIGDDVDPYFIDIGALTLFHVRAK